MTVIDPVILREYDVRGVVGESLDAGIVRALGRAFGTMVRARGGASVAVGYDGRLSSPALAEALAGGLAAAGLAVTDVGRGPTPMLYFATHALPADAGAMITGSHNPPEYNGIKFVCGGKPFWGDDIRTLGRLADGIAAGRDEADADAVTVDRATVFDAYVDRLRRDYSGNRPLRVAWDPGNGAAGEVTRALTATLPGEHVVINAEIDGTFPNHHPDPTVEANLDQLKQAVADNGCDLGIAFDGDGDRIGAVDGQGRVVWGDQLLILLAHEVLRDHPGATVIADVKASRVFFDEIARLGGAPLMWKTGHSLIKAKMQETGAPLAGEMSAHLFIGDRYYGYDDALYAAVRLLSILASGERSLAGFLDSLPPAVSTPEVRFACPEERKFAVIDEVRERLHAAEGTTVVDIDGVRVEGPDGWWLLRASNTQPVLVVRCESDTPAGLDALKAAVTDQLRRSGVEAPDFG